MPTLQELLNEVLEDSSEETEVKETSEESVDKSAEKEIPVFEKLADALEFLANNLDTLELQKKEAASTSAPQVKSAPFLKSQVPAKGGGSTANPTAPGAIANPASIKTPPKPATLTQRFPTGVLNNAATKSAEVKQALTAKLLETIPKDELLKKLSARKSFKPGSEPLKKTQAPGTASLASATAVAKTKPNVLRAEKKKALKKVLDAPAYEGPELKTELSHVSEAGSEVC